jgi:hypothetical protein
MRVYSLKALIRLKYGENKGIKLSQLNKFWQNMSKYCHFDKRPTYFKNLIEDYNLLMPSASSSTPSVSIIVILRPSVSIRP